MNILVDALPMTGLLTGIARYLRNMYAEMVCLPKVEVSYLTAKTVVSAMPVLADSVQWEKNTAAIWKLPDPAVFCLRSAHWLRYEYMLRSVCRKNNTQVPSSTSLCRAVLYCY